MQENISRNASFALRADEARSLSHTCEYFLSIANSFMYGPLSNTRSLEVKEIRLDVATKVPKWRIQT
jgi:hypothetical protein